MSTVTEQQQDVLDAAIHSYISTHDNVAYQYLKFRQSVIEVVQQIQKQKEAGQVSEEALQQLQKLKTEYEMYKVSYPAYVERLTGRINFAENTSPQYLNELEQNYLELSKENEELKANLAVLLDEFAPVVRKMASFVHRFETAFTNRGRGLSHSIGFRDRAPDSTAVSVDYESTVFTKSELAESLKSLDDELRNLKTVDEIDEGEEEKPQTETKLHAIDTLKHLNEVLDRLAAIRTIGSQQVSFALTRSTNVPTNAQHMVVDDYEQAIQALAREIKDLVARGAIAKERWLSNAKKLQAIDEMLHAFDEPMEVD